MIPPRAGAFWYADERSSGWAIAVVITVFVRSQQNEPSFVMHTSPYLAGCPIEYLPLVQQLCELLFAVLTARPVTISRSTTQVFSDRTARSQFTEVSKSAPSQGGALANLRECAVPARFLRLLVRSQPLFGVEPIFLGRSLWTASRSPEFVSQSCYVLMPE
jgi:hypothetical protein